MRLDFSNLSQPAHGLRGQTGTAGTTNSHAASDRPQGNARLGDARGQPATSGLESTRASAKMSPSSPVDDNGRGHCKPACILTVPVVPDVPTQKEPFRHQSGEIDLVREFMEVDGFTLAEATALAAVAVQPRAPDEWLALIAELDDVIEQYCSLTATPGKIKSAILAARRTQSVASIPDSLEWFRHKLFDLEGDSRAKTAFSANMKGMCCAQDERHDGARQDEPPPEGH
jgi:hypothetical protein